MVREQNKISKAIMTSMVFSASNVIRGEGDDDNDDKPNIQDSQEFKDAVAAATQAGLDNAISGLKDKNGELVNKLSDMKEKIKTFDGIDAEKVKTMLSAIEHSEDAKMIADGKFDEVIAKRVDTMRTTFEEQIAELTETSSNNKKERDNFESLLNKKTIEDGIRSALGKSKGFRGEAAEDVLKRGLDIFSLGDTGDIEARTSQGELIKVDGKLLTPERFVESLKETHSYYWESSKSSGSKGNNGHYDQNDELTELGGAMDENGNLDLDRYRATKKKFKS